MSDLAVALVVDAENPVVHDLRLVNGQLILAEDLEAIAQHVKVRLNWFLGEWFLDTREGIPYFRDVFVKSPSLLFLRSLFRAVILGTPGIDVINEFSLEVDSAIRTLNIDFEAITDTGQILSSTQFGPFILEIG
jgi:hypothetical protein